MEENSHTSHNTLVRLIKHRGINAYDLLPRISDLLFRIGILNIELIWSPARPAYPNEI